MEEHREKEDKHINSGIKEEQEKRRTNTLTVL